MKRKYYNLTTDDHMSLLEGTPSSRHLFGCVYLFKIYALGGELENTQLIF